MKKKMERKWEWGMEMGERERERILLLPVVAVERRRVKNNGVVGAILGGGFGK
jgi:hypothetical protein